jgi:hypothetical protein
MARTARNITLLTELEGYRSTVAHILESKNHNLFIKHGVCE